MKPIERKLTCKRPGFRACRNDTKGPCRSACGTTPPAPPGSNIAHTRINPTSTPSPRNDGPIPKYETIGPPSNGPPMVAIVAEALAIVRARGRYSESTAPDSHARPADQTTAEQAPWMTRTYWRSSPDADCCDDKAGRSNQRQATSANTVSDPTGGNGKDHDGEAVGAENETGLAIRETKFGVPNRNQRDRR